MTNVVGVFDFGYADGVGTSALFNHAFGLVWSNTNVLYVADKLNNVIRQVTVTGDFQPTLLFHL